ncbi:MAG: fumarylacetoacetate hydrolase family protein, partial [Bosea sp. (in: a-proteobacteria)]|nr:fumarylacetoacetate hydrolase family protein [Bosea sp. (in: a-proteobacteria)]
RLAPGLADLAEGLEHGSVPSFRFHEHDCSAPLPRAFGRFVGRDGVAEPTAARSTGALGPRQPVRAVDERAGLVAEAGLAVIAGDVPALAGPAQASSLIRLVMLGCRVMETAGAGGDVAREVACSFSPVVVTPDEIGPAWHDGRLDLPLLCRVNQQPLQRGEAAGTVAAGELLAQAAGRQALQAGTIVAWPVALPQEQPLRFGDSVRIEMKDPAGHSIFGAIEQEILPAG